MWSVPSRTTNPAPAPLLAKGTTPLASAKAQAAPKKTRKTKSANEEPKKLVLRRSGMNAAVVLSPALAEMLGTDMMLRRDVISGISKYVHDNNLVVATDRRKFKCDDFLKQTLGHPHVEGEQQFLHINKLISPVLQTPSNKGPEYEVRATQMFADYIKARGAVDSADARRQIDNRGKNSTAAQKVYREKGLGMFRDVYIDGELSRLCDGKSQLSRPQILKAVWRHIKTHDLQTTTNKRKIVVDATLRNALRIFDTDVVDSFHIGRYLWKLCRSEPTSKSS